MCPPYSVRCFSSVLSLSVFFCLPVSSLLFTCVLVFTLCFCYFLFSSYHLLFLSLLLSHLFRYFHFFPHVCQVSLCPMLEVFSDSFLLSLLTMFISSPASHLYVCSLGLSVSCLALIISCTLCIVFSFVSPVVSLV